MRTAVMTETAVDVRVRQTQGRYLIDAARTRVEVTLRCVGMPLRGVFDSVVGALDVPADLRGSQLSVSLDTARFRTGGRHRNRLAGDLLDAETHPTIRFDADRMEPILEPFVTHDGDRPLWALVGRLTLSGVTRTVRIAVGGVSPVNNGDTVEFAATTTVRCSDFGLSRRGGLIGDVVRVSIVGAADRDTG